MTSQRRPLLFDPLSDRDSNIDRIWAGQSSDSSKNFSNYYDYYFSGEDIKVYITAYKPSTSNIYVYAKILSTDDDTKFDDRDWTLLEQVSPAGTFSDSLNEKSFIELEYTFKQTPPSKELQV